MNTKAISELGYVRVAAVSPTVSVANPDGNAQTIIDAASKATQAGAEIIVFPELCVTGYTCADLFRDSDLLRGARAALAKIRRWSAGVPAVLVIGVPLVHNQRLFNCAVVVQDGHYLACIAKRFLPNTGEFYDGRWFTSGRNCGLDTIRLGDADVPFGSNIVVADQRDPSLVLGVEICEDLWSVEPPSGALACGGATIIVNCSASNELVGKTAYRRNLVLMQSARTFTTYAYASCGGTESTTDTVFSSHCMIAECGEMCAERSGISMETEMVIADVDCARSIRERMGSTSWAQEEIPGTLRKIETVFPRTAKNDVLRRIDPHPFVPQNAEHRAERCEQILSIQATGLAVRAKRSGAKALVIGVSGGLDSTLGIVVAVRAAKLLGMPSTSVLAVTMPGPGTTERTKNNATLLSQAMGVELRTVPITEAVTRHLADIGVADTDRSVVYENAQSRERTQILMDVANHCGGIVVGTGDLSEIALGWSTYNADHMSMYNPNCGVPKTLVQHLIRYYADAEGGAVAAVLRDILATPISPELLPTDHRGISPQRTEDVLGPYEVHDFFLYHFVRLREPVRTIATLACIAFSGVYAPSQVCSWFEVFLRRFVANQFKRSAIPDGPKIGSVALSPRADWRMPSDASGEVWLGELRSFADDNLL